MIVRDLGDADWAMRRLAECEEEIAEIERQIDALQARPDAETIRDAMLAVSGKLNPASHIRGPPFWRKVEPARR